MSFVMNIVTVQSSAFDVTEQVDFSRRTPFEYVETGTGRQQQVVTPSQIIRYGTVQTQKPVTVGGSAAIRQI